MNFLAPWFLAGALLIVGPIVVHLIRRSNRERVAFSATRFLDVSHPRLQRRSRLQHPLLLALRCLIVALLAAAFARPFFPSESAQSPATGMSQEVVILLDDSASMQRAGLWAEARARTQQIVRQLRDGDRCSIFAGGGAVRTLLSSEQWIQTPKDNRVALVGSILEQAQPGWGPTYLDSAVEAALDGFSEVPVEAIRRRLIIVSDFASGSRISGMAARDWPQNFEVVLERITPPLFNNAGVQWVGWTGTTGTPRQARLRVTRDRAALRLPLRLQLYNALTGERVGAEERLELDAGESRNLALSVPDAVNDPLRVELAGDSEPFDNQSWIVPVALRERKVAYVGTDDPADPQRPHFYVARALGSMSEVDVRVERVDPNGPANSLDAAKLILIAAPPGPALATALRAQLERGAHVLVLVSSPELATSAAALAGETGWGVTTSKRADALFGHVDFEHPLFSLFADPRFSDFTRIRFWRPSPITLPAASHATVVARFDDDSPAVFELPVGRGRVIVWGGDWAPTAGQWVLSSKFVPWLQALLERASGGPPHPVSTDIANLHRLGADAGTTWRAAGRPADVFSPNAPTQPGLYQLRNDTGTHWVALQVPAEESRTEPLPLDAFEQLGVPLRVATLAAPPTARPVIDAAALETEGRQKLWRWLLLATAAFLALESLAAVLAIRRESATPDATTSSGAQAT